MNSFTLTAIGTLARNPGTSTSGNLSYARFCLVGSDFEEIDGALKERVISMWFVAFGPVGDSLVKYARKGDQLILEAAAVVDDWSGRRGCAPPETMTSGARATVRVIGILCIGVNVTPTERP